jgi:hypothetical protein
VLAATLLTLRDAAWLAQSVNPRPPLGRGTVGVIGAGLRSGAFEAKVSATPAQAVTIEGLVLKRDVFIPGVVVSAKLIRRSGKLRGTVRLRGTLAGRLRLHGRLMRGLVGGRRVRVPAVLAARRA